MPDLPTSLDLTGKSLRRTGIHMADVDVLLGHAERECVFEGTLEVVCAGRIVSTQESTRCQNPTQEGPRKILAIVRSAGRIE